MKLLIDTEWATFIADLPEEKQLEFFWAIFDYGKKDCSLKCWEKIQPVLEKGKIGYFNKLNNLKQYKNDNTTESVSESVSEREYKYNNNINNNNTRNSNKGGMGGNNFIPPKDADEVYEYAQVSGMMCSKEQAQDFYDYYSGIGWRIGNEFRTPINDWHPFWRKWLRNPIATKQAMKSIPRMSIKEIKEAENHMKLQKMLNGEL